jgi:SulP family sulfate permease
LGRRYLIADLVAGLSVAVVAIPQALAYADVAGMPPVHGLYATALPPLAAALFASSPYLQTGPVAITSLLTFGALSAQVSPGSDHYVQLGLALALVVGVSRIALGALRAGIVAYLMSQPMLLGFVPAAALIIVGSQLPNALGSAAPEGSPLEQSAWSLMHPGDWEPAAIAVSLAVLLLVIGGRRLHALFPGVLWAAALGIVATVLLDYPGETVSEIPTTLPPVSADLPWGELPGLVVPGAVIALVGFSEAAAISRRFASEDRAPWNPDREFVSQGVANVAAAFTGGLPCGGSFSRSSVSRMSGARTRLSGAVTGIAVLLFLPFASIMEPLPTAVLGSIVIAAVIPLVRLSPVLALWRLSPPQFVVAAATFAATLALSPRIQDGVLIGVGLSLLVFLWRMLHLEVEITVDGEELRIRPRGVLWFATAQKLEDALVSALAQEPHVQQLRVDLSGVSRVDTTSALAIRALLAHARSGGLDAEIDNAPLSSHALREALLCSEHAPRLY